MLGQEMEGIGLAICIGLRYHPNRPSCRWKGGSKAGGGGREGWRRGTDGEPEDCEFAFAPLTFEAVSLGGRAAEELFLIPSPTCWLRILA